MVRVVLTSGSLAGQVIGPQVGIEPVDFFAFLVRQGWTWEADYSEATWEETLEWFRMDLGVRIIRALKRGLPVRFMDREYRIGEKDVLEVAQNLEDDIAASGRLVAIDSDDERGLVIGIRGYEQ